MDGLVMRTWFHVSSDMTNTKSFYSSTSKFMHKYYPFTTLRLCRGKKGNSKRFVLNDDVVLEGSSGNSDEFNGRNMSWVLNILQVGSVWNLAEKKGMSEGQNGNFTSGCDLGGSDQEFKQSCSGGCGVCDGDGDDEEGEVGIDKESFRKMLKKVSLGEAKLFLQLCYLGSLAYAIPIIKPRNMLKRYGLKYITSSIEKRQQLAVADQKPQPVNPETPQESSETDHSDGNNSQIIDAEYSNSDMSSLRTTTDSVTSVVAANEEVKQAVADDLNSMISSPCEWYICDDHKTATRYFVIQGSETLASWQANLLFEPVQFEGLDVFVHRGIYEAAKGIYQQILPEVDAFMKTHGDHAKFRFTGHSLGGSLSMLINLMLLIRGVVPYFSLLHVVTFGSPCIMCGGDYLLHKLGLPKTHVQAIVMHRDIVPRVFSCYYPKPAAEFLKAVNGNFRNHPCLNNQKLLYAPMGEMLILQPDSKHSPQHHLLPSYSGLFLLTSNGYEGEDAENQLRTAVSAFLNTPHPLEILNDRSSYGSDGAILRDHDINSYLKCLQTVVSLELGQLRKNQHKAGWYLKLPRVIGGTTLSSSHVGQTQFRFPRSGIKESLKLLTGLVKSQDMNSVLVFVGTYSIIDSGMRAQF